MNTEPRIPRNVLDVYEIHEWRNAIAVLKGAHPKEWAEILGVLDDFMLLRSEIVRPGGAKSAIARRLDSKFYDLEWEEKRFATTITVDERTYESPTHSIDCYKNNVAVEVEWNNKDPFYDRDLNNFRLLYDLRAVDVGVIITRSDELQQIFKELGRATSYGASTTHMSRLLPRIEGGGGGGCPILVFGITRRLYVED